MTRCTSSTTRSPTRSAGTRSRLGGEYRRFLNDNFAEGTGLVQLSRAWRRSWPEPPTRSASRSASGAATSPRTPSAFFVQDQIALGRSFTLDLGLRYEWHVTPTERDDQFVVFDADTRVAGARRRRRRRDLSAEQPATSSRGSAWPGRRRRTVARWCAPPTAGRSTSRARRWSGTRPATRRSRFR